jgi:hypothetical protein
MTTYGAGMADRAGNVRAFPGGIAKMPRAKRASSIKPEHIRWLSPGRLAAGKITILDGDPGLGKSQIAIDWVARITTGRALPGAAGWTDDDPVTAARGAVLLSAEDGEADTIVPRLLAAGADLNRVILLDMVDDQGNSYLPSIDGDLDAIEAQIEAANAAILVLDPLMSYLGRDVNANRDQDVRQVLSPLASMLARTGCSSAILRHLNKASGMASLYRGGGSIGIIGAARVGLIAAKDAKDESGKRRILAVQKCNIGPEGPSLAYRIVGVPDLDTSRVEWLGETNETADQLLAAPASQSERDEATESEVWLFAYLSAAENNRVEATTVFRDGGKQGFSQITLRRAKSGIGAKALRQGFGKDGVWVWQLGVGSPADTRMRARVAANPFAEDEP